MDIRRLEGLADQFIEETDDRFHDWNLRGALAAFFEWLNARDEEE